MKNLCKARSKMRLILLLQVVITIYGCKKDHSLTPDINTGSIAAEMKQWLNQQKTDTAYVTKLLSQIDWPGAHILAADSGKSYEVASLNSPTIFDDTTKTQQRYLVLQKQGDKITGGLIYELYGNKKDIANKADLLITNFDQQSISNFNGTATIYNWTNSIKKSKTFVNGINTSYAILIAKSSLNKKEILDLKKKTNTCTDWYWITYIDGYAAYQEYVGTTCDDNNGYCEPVSIRNGKGTMSVKLNCASGGGASTNLCADDEQVAFNEAQSTVDNTDDGSAEEFVDPFHKNVTFNWICMKGTAGTWDVHSSEIASEYSSDGVHNWRFIGLSHNTSHVSGAPIAGSITVSVTKATAAVSDYRASMNLSLYELVQFSCEGFNIQIYDNTTTASKTWYLDGNN